MFARSGSRTLSPPTSLSAVRATPWSYVRSRGSVVVVSWIGEHRGDSLDRRPACVEAAILRDGRCRPVGCLLVPPVLLVPTRVRSGALVSSHADAQSQRASVARTTHAVMATSYVSRHMFAIGWSCEGPRHEEPVIAGGVVDRRETCGHGLVTDWSQIGHRIFNTGRHRASNTAMHGVASQREGGWAQEERKH